ncbi:hypothetical protein CIW49_17415 [Mycolicibacterium sp. P1-18]|uniref:hypothetical protein n=1 Tax=Mycolicibacterium sp. P1-18 TaxID=2024615 RepID=UPI0011F26A7A|nr:hypothetical protein [Mycolicibacterium sp. P1-18]KAA0097631.1 hypothetical protein CIW49_17415 [Mycolicibacterium sp. P1-18]
MSETTSSSESATGPVETPATTTPATTTPVVVHDGDGDVDARRRGGRLNVVAAWVGIVAGTVFVVAVIFFSGFALGASVGGGGHHHHGHGESQMERDGGGPRHGWPGGPGGFGPGVQGGPGFEGGPGQGPGSPPPPPPGR